MKRIYCRPRPYDFFDTLVSFSFSDRACFETTADAAEVSRASEFYNRLYRLAVLDGVSDG